MSAENRLNAWYVMETAQRLLRRKDAAING